MHVCANVRQREKLISDFLPTKEDSMRTLFIILQRSCIIYTTYRDSRTVDIMISTEIR